MEDINTAMVKNLLAFGWWSNGNRRLNELGGTLSEHIDASLIPYTYYHSYQLRNNPSSQSGDMTISAYNFSKIQQSGQHVHLGAND